MKLISAVPGSQRPPRNLVAIQVTNCTLETIEGIVFRMPLPFKTSRKRPFRNRDLGFLVVRLPVDLFLIGQGSQINEVGMDLSSPVDIIGLERPRATA